MADRFYPSVKNLRPRLEKALEGELPEWARVFLGDVVAWSDNDCLDGPDLGDLKELGLISNEEFDSVSYVQD